MRGAYIMMPGARLLVGPHGRLDESLGADEVDCTSTPDDPVCQETAYLRPPPPTPAEESQIEIDQPSAAKTSPSAPYVVKPAAAATTAPSAAAAAGDGGMSTTLLLLGGAALAAIYFMGKGKKR